MGGREEKGIIHTREKINIVQIKRGLRVSYNSIIMKITMGSKTQLSKMSVEYTQKNKTKKTETIW